MITLEVNGTEYGNFLNINAERSYMAVPGSFSFVATTSPENLTGFPIANGDPCRVMVDGKPFITGNIDQIEVVHDEDTHQINVQGRSLVADLVDSTMNGDYEIKGPIPLKTALEKIIKLAGLTITVIDETGGVDDFAADEGLSGDVGAPVWELMVKLAIKKQVLLTENGQGNVIMTRGYGARISDKLIKEPNGRENNILGSRCKRGTRERFNTYTVLSQDDSVSLASIDIENFDAVASSNKQGKATDDAIRLTRFQCLVSEKASTPDECQLRAVWQSNFNRVLAFAYSCSVQGFVNDEGDVFEPGMMPHVRDEFMQVNSELVIDRVALSYSGDNGSISSIDFLLPDAFTLAASEPKFEDSGNDLEGFF